MTDLEANVDLYGVSAQRSCLADFLELEAISGRRPSESHLADYIEDAEWTVLSDERFFEPSLGVAPPRSYGSVEVAKQVLSTIAARLDMLGEDRYPFRIERGRVIYVGNDDRLSPYLALLAITVAHAYSIEVPTSPEEILPRTVSGVLAELGLRAVCFSDLREDYPFVDAISLAGEALLLDATPEEGLRSVNVNDAGGDVVAAVGWGDHRPGAWAFVGQVTCGKSESWRKKAFEPSRTSWELFLNTRIRPLRFLAVPHHAEPQHFQWLVQETEGIILDRVRLGMFKETVTEEERACCEAVFATLVTHLY